MSNKVSETSVVAGVARCRQTQEVVSRLCLLQQGHGAHAHDAPREDASRPVDPDGGGRECRRTGTQEAARVLTCGFASWIARVFTPDAYEYRSSFRRASVHVCGF